jgi:hypothetical protein
VEYGGFDGGVADIALDEGLLRIARGGIQVREVSSVAQSVVVNDGVVLAQAQNVSDEIRFDEAGAPGDENFHRAGSWRLAPDERFILFSPIFAIMLSR